MEHEKCGYQVIQIYVHIILTVLPLHCSCRATLGGVVCGAVCGGAVHADNVIVAHYAEYHLIFDNITIMDIPLLVGW